MKQEPATHDARGKASWNWGQQSVSRGQRRKFDKYDNKIKDKKKKKEEEGVLAASMGTQGR